VHYAVEGFNGTGCDLLQVSEGVAEDAAVGKAQFVLESGLREPAIESSGAHGGLPGGVRDGRSGDEGRNGAKLFLRQLLVRFRHSLFLTSSGGLFLSENVVIFSFFGRGLLCSSGGLRFQDKG
jgi:hypothetical protein